MTLLIVCASIIRYLVKENLIDSFALLHKKRPCSEGDTRQAQKNQKYCPGQPGKSTDEDGELIKSNIGFSGKLHDVEKIYHEQCNKPHNYVYPLCDICHENFENF
ncbi:MAG: hypothetical protein Q7T80_07885 [Methanoregula sp.]|nr:hypothetical protein [Methanoregula sp.]